MALPKLTSSDAGERARGKINAAIAEAEKVADKASAAAVDGLAREVSAKADRAEVSAIDAVAAAATSTAQKAAQMAPPSTHRPGDGLRAFTFVASLAALGGEADALAPLDGSRVAFAAAGGVVRLVGQGILAAREAEPIEPGRIREVRAAFRRRANTSDPSNDTVRTGLLWLDQAKRPLAGPVFSTIADLDALTTASGRQEVKAYVSAAAGEGITIVAPSGAAYFRRFVYNFGLDGVTDVETLASADVTGLAIPPTITTDVLNRLAAQESVNPGPRLENIEQQLGSPNNLTFPTRSDAMGASVDGGISTLTLLGDVVQGDAAPRTYGRIAGALPPGEDGFATSDGAIWRRVFLAATDLSRPSLPTIGIGLTRTTIPSRPVSLMVDRFQLDGWFTPGDGGCGAYVRDPSNGAGPMAIKDALNVWWMLDVSGDTMPLGAFGPLGTGDDTATVNTAIATMSPYIYQSNATEMNRHGRSGAIAFPRRPIFCQGKVRLSPNIRLTGQSSLNDWVAVFVMLGNVLETDWTRLGSALVYTGTGGDTYFIDTAPYNNLGQRLDDALVSSIDVYNGIVRPVDGVQIDQLAIIGNYKCKGLNFAACNDFYISNPYIIGFPVGIRLSSAFNGTLLRPRIFTNWRGIIAWKDVTAPAIIDAKIGGTIQPNHPEFSAPAYTGGDAALPAVDSWWTAEKNAWCCGIYSWYCNLTLINPTIENFDCAFIAHNSKINASAIYVERINPSNKASCSIIVERGNDQQHSRYDFKTITANPNAGVLLLKNAITEVRYLSDNYMQQDNTRSYKQLITDMENDSIEFLPRIEGLPFTPQDAYDETFVVLTSKQRRVGSWEPKLTFGGISAGAQQNNAGTWSLDGDRVIVTFRVLVPAKSGATGIAKIDGLPFRGKPVAGGFGEFSGLISFVYGMDSTVLPVLRLIDGEYSLTVGVNVTNEKFASEIELKGSFAYITDEAQYL